HSAVRGGRKALLPQSHQQVVGVDGGAGGHGDGLDRAVHGGGHLNLHLHGLQNDQHVAGLHALAHGALHLKDAAGHGAVHRGLAGAHRDGGGGGGRSRLSRGGGSRSGSSRRGRGGRGGRGSGSDGDGRGGGACSGDA